MAKIRLYLDLETLVTENQDFKEVEIYECESSEDTGILIDTVNIKAGVDYVESTLATDIFSWFRVSILGNGESFDSDVAVLAEVAQEKMEWVRKELKDTAAENPAFTDAELISKIRMAALRYKKIRNLSEVPENVWGIISILVRIDCCYILAYDYAKYVRLEIPGGASLGKDELYRHYLEIARQLEEYYGKIRADLDKEEVVGEEQLLSVHISNMELDRSGIK